MIYLLTVIFGLGIFAIIGLAAFLSGKLNESKDWAVVTNDGVRSEPMTKKEAQQVAWITGGKVVNIKKYV